ncbi:NAD(P)/FAD-dependent oxidoreductase [Gloeothece verrucosa]|uniref:FAD dependent oxidoreductase n=1 Tax=Gloeothece verrucosa (strain PCC 7822) TaxID=497965 RepID=E0U7X2_GLOV7|nr:NAD(P)/FAD-dependent oxidoreductase [Gloeothece verrucosa]ADN16059.1 FAD dependent oxidoreductase [Gloeothece verrucosa PCC 7822]
MQYFDVVIVGAGPAGGHCARLLAKLGYSVLLVEQHESFQQNIFSSAATPLETLELFNLPPSVVASFWHKLEIVTTKVHRHWEANNTLGAVFDFAKLRAFLAKDAEINGAKVWLGHRYVKAQQESEKLLISLKPKRGEEITVSSQVLVDATGFARAVMYPDKRQKPKFLKGTGIEYLIEVEQDIYQKYAHSLVFFMGYQWSPKGYSWIFPMQENQFKVGSAWIDAPHKFIAEVKPLKFYIGQIIKDYLKIEDYKLLDVHGSILEYSIGLNDIYYREPNIIAIGDAVSTVNFLGGEGIRHALKGTEIAVPYIENYLNSKCSNFRQYQEEIKSYFAPKWNLSEQISRRVYLEYSDQKIDQGVAYLKYLSLSDLMDILFYYKFEKFTRGLGGYLKSKIGQMLGKIKSLWSNKL